MTALTRRSLLKAAAGTGALAALGPTLLAACGGDDSGSGSGTQSARGSSTTAAPKKGGRLRVGGLTGGSSEAIDPMMGPNSIDFVRQGALYDKPLNFKQDGQGMEFVLAESIESNDALDKWTIRLIEGVEFHHGKTLGAEDLQFTLERLAGPDAATSSVFKSIDLASFKKLDDRTLEFMLKEKGNYLIRELMASYRACIVPVDFDPANPVGTGPFKYKSFTPGEQSVFERFDNYWRSDVYLDELVVTSFADDAALYNAFQAGQLDAMDDVTASQKRELEADRSVTLYQGYPSQWSPIVMNTQTAPFDDPKVRQAMRLIADRQQLVDQTMQGDGQIMNDIPLHYSYFGYPDVPQREQDIEEAKSLLKSAGHEGLSVELVVSALTSITVPGAEVYAEQAREADVNVKVTTIDAGEFYGDAFLSRPFTTDYWGAQTYLMQASSFLLPGAFYNETGWQDEEWNRLVDEALVTKDDDKRGELLLEAQTIDYERGGYINWGATGGYAALKSNLAGWPEGELLHPYTSMNDAQFEKLYYTD